MNIKSVQVLDSALVRGEPLRPDQGDILAVLGRLDVGEPVPDGWRVLTGNAYTSLVAATFFRHELES